MAQALGKFLRCLHSYDVTQVVALGVPQASEEDTFAAVRDRALERLSSLRSVLTPGFSQRCLDFLQDSSYLPGEYTGPQKLVHADLLADHILIAPSLDNITGVIDWSDMTVGDPAGDFAGLWEWQGTEFVQTALRSYGSVINGGMWDRIRFQGIYVALMHVYYGHKARISSRVEFGLACLQRIFGSS
jgi:aminoglycoside 2''-phosphotransferase